MSALASGRKGVRPGEPTGHLSGTTPDGHVYWDDAVLRTELDRFYYRSWLIVGREEQIPHTGD